MDKSSISSREAVPAATHDGKEVSGPFKDETDPGHGASVNFTGAARRSSAAGTTVNIIENPLTVSPPSLKSMISSSPSSY
jgi:hypothetical protein